MGEQMPPSVGRIVHYTLADGACAAAIITALNPDPELAKLDAAGMVVFVGGGIASTFSGWSTVRGEPGQKHTWHWPERVSANA